MLAGVCADDGAGQQEVRARGRDRNLVVVPKAVEPDRESWGLVLMVSPSDRNYLSLEVACLSWMVGLRH